MKNGYLVSYRRTLLDCSGFPTDELILTFARRSQIRRIADILLRQIIPKMTIICTLLTATLFTLIVLFAFVTAAPQERRQAWPEFGRDPTLAGLAQIMK